MRLFIAIEISEEILNALAWMQSHLKYAGADVKWVEKDNIHLTLKFLGEVKEEKVGEIKAILDDVAKGFTPFDMTVKGIGAFPKIDFPKVIWAGLDKGANESKELAEVIDNRLSNIGFQRESRPFAAHLTIGRVKSPKNKDALKEKIISINNDVRNTICEIRIESLFLIQSTLTPNGPLYTKLHESRLA